MRRESDSTGGFSFGTFLWSLPTPKDHIAAVRIVFSNESSAPLDIQVNLSYQLTYDDIKAIFPERVKVLHAFYEEIGWPEDREPLPIIWPEREIRLAAKEAQIDSLSYYIKKLVLDPETERIAAQKLLENTRPMGFVPGGEEKSSEIIDPPLCQRIVYIPLNTGGHWTTLILYITKDNHIGDVCYIDPLTSKGTIQYLVKEMDESFDPIWISKAALHQKLNECSQALTTNLPEYALPQDHPIVQQLGVIDGRFIKAENPKRVHRKFSYFQSDSIACGVLSMELAIDVIKKVYLGARHIIRPTWCDQNLTAKIRTHHIKAVGMEHSFYKRQLENKCDVADPVTHAYMMYGLNRQELLNKEGAGVLKAIMKLDLGHQRLLLVAFRPQNSGKVNEEEIGPHVKRIRRMMILIRGGLIREREQLLKTKEILEVRFRPLGGISQCSSEKASPSVGLLDSQEALKLSQFDLEARFAAFAMITQRLYGVSPEAVGEVFGAPLVIKGQHEQVKVIANYLEERLVKASSSGYSTSTKRGSPMPGTSNLFTLNLGASSLFEGLPPSPSRNTTSNNPGTTHNTTFHGLGF